MKTFMNETLQIEAYLAGQADPVLEARLLLDNALRQKVSAQQKTYALIETYGRKKLMNEIEQVHQALFTQEQHIAFRQKIMRLFE